MKAGSVRIAGKDIQSLWNLWREYVAWPWRWLSYALLGAFVFYAVEDLRGALAWRSFLKKNPDYRYERNRFKTSRTETSNFLVRRVNYVPEALRYFQSNNDFVHISVDRTREFVYSLQPNRALEYPLPPFRRCGVWYPSALWKNGSQINEIDAARTILDDGGLFEAFENNHGAEIRKRLVKGIPESEFDYEIKLYMRCLLWRAIAHWELGDFPQCLANLKRVLTMLNQFDDGKSVVRSNDVVPDIMNCLQIIWQAMATKQFEADDLADLQKLIKAIAYEESANESAVNFARAACRELDRLKWSFKNRMEKFDQTQSASIGLSGTEKFHQILGKFRWKTYLLLMPNGWIDHNKIRVCREMEIPESQPPLGRFSVTRSLAENQFAFVHRFNPQPTEAYLRCAVAAIAAERYRIEMQKEPYSLRAMVPEYLETELLDPYRPGQALVFDFKGSRPVFYSVGPNQKDDKGIPRAPIKDGDLVWRYSLPEGFTYNDYILY